MRLLVYAHAYFSPHDTPPRVQHFSAFHLLSTNVLASFPASPPHARALTGGEKGGGESGIFNHVGDVGREII